MWPDQVSNLGPLALGSDAQQTALRGPASYTGIFSILTWNHENDAASRQSMVCRYCNQTLL